MPRRKIGFLIDSRREILDICSILGSFLSKTAKIDHFDQNDPKIELVFQIRMHRSIRNLFLRLAMYLHRHNIMIPRNENIPTIMRTHTRHAMCDSRYTHISWDHHIILM